MMSKVFFAEFINLFNSERPLIPVFSVKTPVLNTLHNMLFLNGFFTVKVGVVLVTLRVSIRSCGEVKSVKCRFQSSAASLERTQNFLTAALSMRAFDVILCP